MNDKELNPNRESQQQYFGITQPQYFGAAKVFTGQPIRIDMNDDNRFNNNNQNNAGIIQAQIRQAQSLEQLHYQQRQTDPCYICRQKEEDLKKQLTDSLNNCNKMLEQKRESEIEILQLKLEVAQLRLALAKAEK